MISHFRYTPFNEFSSSAPFRTNASIVLQTLSELCLFYLLLALKFESVFEGRDYHFLGVLFFFGQFFCYLFFVARFFVSPDSWVAHFRKYKALSQRSHKDPNFGVLKCLPSSILLALCVSAQLCFLLESSPGFDPRLLVLLPAGGAVLTPIWERLYSGRQPLYHTRVGWSLAFAGASALVFLAIDLPRQLNFFAVAAAIVMLFAGSLGQAHADWLFSRAVTSLFRFSGLEALLGASVLACVQLAALSLGSGLNPARAAAAAFSSPRSALLCISVAAAAGLRALATATIQQHASPKKRMFADVFRTIAFALAWQFLPLGPPDQFPPFRLVLFSIAVVMYIVLLLANALIYEVHPIEAFGLNRFYGRYFTERPTSLDLDTSRDFSFMT